MIVCVNMDEELKQQILKTRRMSPDNKLVTYDLTQGVDFSHPRKTAEALSEVFFQEDISKWFKVKGGRLDFKADYKAEIILTSDHDKKIKATIKDFRKDVINNEFYKNYWDQINAISSEDAIESNGAIPAYIGAGFPLSDDLGEMRELLQKLLDAVMSITTIRYAE